MVEITITRLDPDVPLPSVAHPGDAGADLTTTFDVRLGPGERALVRTGIGIALPEGYVALGHPRSGPAARFGVSIVNAQGTLVVPQVEDVRFVELDRLPGSARGVGGYRSTGGFEATPTGQPPVRVPIEE